MVAIDPPPPLTPADCDLRNFPYMPLDCARFRDSAFASTEDDGAFRGGVMAWVVCWHQIPAASLPDDDRQLCKLLGYGREVDLWIRTRAAGALHGFVLCNDGRLYHPVIAEKANLAWTAKLHQREAGIRGNAKRWGTKKPAEDKQSDRVAESTVSLPDHEEIATRSHSDRHPIAEPSPADRNGKGKGEKEDLAEFASAKSTGVTKRRRANAKPKCWSDDTLFVAFQAAYPKADRSPARTHAAWIKALKLTAPAEIMDGLAVHPFNPEEQFRPDPANWLTGQSWHKVARTAQVPAPTPTPVKTAAGRALSEGDLWNVPT
jgi:hypothetical protein